MFLLNIKKWLDNHPGPAVLGIAVSVATTTAAITTYFNDQLHKEERAQIESKHFMEVSDLTTRLSSIERRAGSNQSKRYFDVQSMQISASEIRNLSNQFTSFDDGGFFLNPPPHQGWTYGFVSYLEVMKLGVFKSIFEQSIKNEDQLRAMLERNTLHKWHSAPAGDIKYAVDSNELKWNGSLTSHVKIQRVTRQGYASNAATVAGALQQSLSEPKKDVGNAIDEIERLKKESATEDVDAKTVETADQTKRMFEQIFDGDLAGIIFVDILDQNARISTLGPNVSFSVVSAQKQLNVMYVDLEIRFSRARIEKSYDDSCKEGTTPTVAIRREIFFVSYGGGGYLISTEVPTCDGRSKAFDWINQWLAGLRIAVKNIS